VCPTTFQAVFSATFCKSCTCTTPKKEATTKTTASVKTTLTSTKSAFILVRVCVCLCTLRLFVCSHVLRILSHTYSESHSNLHSLTVHIPLSLSPLSWRTFLHTLVNFEYFTSKICLSLLPVWVRALQIYSHVRVCCCFFICHRKMFYCLPSSQFVKRHTLSAYSFQSLHSPHAVSLCLVL